MSSPSVSNFGSKFKKKHMRPKHQKVKLFRANEPLLSVLMWGVNHTINQLTHINIPVMLMPDDFKSFSKIRVDNYLFNKENMPSHFKVKEYCPLVFRNLRERFSVHDHDYMQSLTRAEATPMDSPGKSGAKFYQSYDKLYIIKALTSEEVELMHSFLKEYHPYIVERHGKTLLPQYLGMYRFTVDGLEHYLVVMRNVFSNHLPLHKKYDLKGSTVDRDATSKELRKELPTLKDNDFVKDGMHVEIGGLAKEKLMDTLSADVAFLSRLQLMDYSLLLGVHDVERHERERQEAARQPADEEPPPLEEEDDSCGSGCAAGGGGGSGGPASVPTPPDSPQIPDRHRLSSDDCIDPHKDIYAIPSSDGDGTPKYIYFLAIIDVLTHYGMKKQAAKAAKTVKYGSGVDGISTVGPEVYGRRFLEFMQQAIA
ncbi:phosphatidylinositol 5-phosphate 4-kinase type-2 alpha-like [Amphibalanus amphitrite]|uniref:phosphatidylinositol 5-phosphate 4-kinase type-2 alpha-like n=1 Tax=Amphibalanus amphitrite TaxID=1232801 RepID=UPI001C8FC399|nr:phosphatidylinositol 5-phosphate 4-kinase type-2 alpha-like [Amphibalanus amphitrite]